MGGREEKGIRFFVAYLKILETRIITSSHLYFDLTILGQSRGEKLKRSWQVMLGVVVQAQAEGVCASIEVIEREAILPYLLSSILG
jgi:hypothetical protein